MQFYLTVFYRAPGYSPIWAVSLRRPLPEVAVNNLIRFLTLDTRLAFKRYSGNVQGWTTSKETMTNGQQYFLKGGETRSNMDSNLVPTTSLKNHVFHGYMTQIEYSVESLKRIGPSFVPNARCTRRPYKSS